MAQSVNFETYKDVGCISNNKIFEPNNFIPLAGFELLVLSFLLLESNELIFALVII